jgi:hypothetical protein
MLRLREMALATLMQCETRWRAVLASFDERYEKLITDHPDAKKELDLVRGFVVQIWQLVQNSPEVNGNGAQSKRLADRHTLYKFLDGQAVFTCSNVQGNEGQPSVGTAGCFTSGMKQTLKETETLKLSAASRNRRGHLRLTKTHGRWQ